MKNIKQNLSGPRIFIGIILLTCLLIFVGYFGVKKYRDYQAQQAQQLDQEKNIADTQNRALEEARAEIEKLKTQTAQTKEKQDALEKTVTNEQQKSKSAQSFSGFNISASEIEQLLTGTVKITCENSSGSGSLWTIDSNRVVITNQHVVTTPFYSDFNSQSYCAVWVNNLDDEYYSSYVVFPTLKWRWNDETDIAVMNLVEHFDPDGNSPPENFQKPVNQLNYKISSLKKCSNQITLGSPVAIIGYPAFGMQSIFGGLGTNDARIVSNGIVSGYDKTVTPPLGPLPFQNYFISAKIDSGNSGGIAIAKTESGLCVLGIPTWLNVGNYDTQGIVQNINNIFYSSI